MDARPGRAGAIDRIAGDRHEARVQKEGTRGARGRQNKLHGDGNSKSNSPSTVHPALFILGEKFYS